MNAILKELSRSGEGSFLAVLKLLGPEDFLISFPMEGYTLALDIPIKPKNFELMNRLDQIVVQYGGRLYLSKDARMPAEMMGKGYPKLPEFIEIKRKVDPNGQFESLQSQRLGLQ
jgi:FAD/FMN-containing dehydrogenase